MSEAQYMVGYASTSRSQCKGPKACNEKYIQQGDLRFGSHFEVGEFPRTAWRHWHCVTAKLISNINSRGGVAALSGFDELREEDQVLIREALERGHIAEGPGLEAGKRQKKADKDEAEGEAKDKAPLKPRGRPKKEDKEEAKEKAPPKKRGRPKKKKEENQEEAHKEQEEEHEEEEEEKPKPKRKKAAPKEPKPKKAPAAKKAPTKKPAGRGRGKKAAAAGEEEEHEHEEAAEGAEEAEEAAAGAAEPTVEEPGDEEAEGEEGA